MTIKEQISLFDKLMAEAEEIDYNSREKLNLLEEQAKLYIRKFISEESNYILRIENITYIPIIITSSTSDELWMNAFNRGIKKFVNLINIIIQDLKLSTNYMSDFSIQKKENIKSRFPKNEEHQIHILIASPNDLKEERELLLDSLETKFRRNGYEETCGYRIIIHGWEELATQPGYGQDLINNKINEDIDIILSVFKHKLGTPTKDVLSGDLRSRSGTVEELLFGLKNNENSPLGMVYFYSNAPCISFDAPSFEKDLQEWKDLKKFKTEVQDYILYRTYTSSTELLTLACDDLLKNIIEYYPQVGSSTSLEKEKSMTKNINFGSINTGGGNVNIGDKIN